MCLTLQYSTLPCVHHSPQAWHLGLEGVCCDHLASWQALAWLGIWGCEVRKGSLILLAWEVHGAACLVCFSASSLGRVPVWVQFLAHHEELPQEGAEHSEDLLRVSCNWFSQFLLKVGQRDTIHQSC